MRQRRAISFALLAMIILIVLFIAGAIVVFSDVVENNVEEDITKTLSLSLRLQTIGVEDVSDGVVDPNKDIFMVKAFLDEKGYQVPYEEILIIFEINGQRYSYEYGEFEIQQLQATNDDEVLYPNDIVIFKVPSPVLLKGSEEVTLELKRMGSDSQLRVHLDMPRDLRGTYQVIR